MMDLLGNLVFWGTAMIIYGAFMVGKGFMELSSLGDSTNDNDYRERIMVDMSKYYKIIFAGLAVSFIGIFL